MMTVKEVSKLSGVSIRTLQYYDNIGLLQATAHTQAGYRMYDENALERLQQILLFRELEFPLKDIAKILKSPDFDQEKALHQQIELLELKKEHIENLISLARGIHQTGDKNMDFSAFDKTKMDAYTKQAKELWGKTDAYAEFEKKSADRSDAAEKALGTGLMDIFADMGKIKNEDPDSEAALAQVRKLQDYITEHYYTCTKPILMGLGQMYAAGGEFTQSIDAVGGVGTAQFANAAIESYCK